MLFGTSLLRPEASVNKPNQVQRKWLSQPPRSSTLCSGSFGWTRVMEAPQAQWLWPCWREKNKEKRPWEASRPSRSQTTPGWLGVETPRAQPSSAAGCAIRSWWVGHRVPTKRREAKRLHYSAASTARRHLLPPTAGATSRPKPLPRTTWTMTRARVSGIPRRGKTRTTRLIGLATGARQGPSRAALVPRSGPVGPR